VFVKEVKEVTHAATMTGSSPQLQMKGDEKTNLIIKADRPSTANSQRP
jgi:hypothetical protein